MFFLGGGLVNPRGGKVQPSHKHKTHVPHICALLSPHGECVYKIKHIRHMCVQPVPSHVYNLFPHLRGEYVY